MKRTGAFATCSATCSATSGKPSAITFALRSSVYSAFFMYADTSLASCTLATLMFSFTVICSLPEVWYCCSKDTWSSAAWSPNDASDFRKALR
jgi:hypothetical protein